MKTIEIVEIYLHQPAAVEKATSGDTQDESVVTLVTAQE